jgi:hypothetical protein
MDCCATRPARPAVRPVPIETTARFLALTCSRPPGAGRAMAKATSISRSSPGKFGTMTHDYCVTTLFAALNVQDGTVLGLCMPSTGAPFRQAS